MVELVYFPENQIALRTEVIKIPELLKQIKDAECEDFTEELAVIAAFCGIVVDGDYYQEEISKLIDICYLKLRDYNRLIIN